MTRKILLADNYRDKQTEVERIIDTFEQQGSLVHKGRNYIKTFSSSAGEWNVKRYHKPLFVNRIAYSFFRMPKGLRAFEYPQRVIAAGFETPAPVAYVEERTLGLIGFSYFVSEQCPYTRRFYEFGNATIDQCQEVITAFAQFTAGLHKAGIYHRDYSPGNILFDKVNGQWHFSIVDINRMEFGPVSIEKGCKNFARLWGQPEMFHLIAQTYARARHADFEQCTKWVMEARTHFWKPRVKGFDLPFELKF